MPDSMFYLVCMICGARWDDIGAANCPHDGGALDVVYADKDFPLFPELPGIWRYAARLPLSDRQHIISLGEGQTPLLPSARLGPDAGMNQIYFKNEGLNPSGSYKDRIATVGISLTRQLGKGGWSATSSGNAGASLAAYGAKANMTGWLFTLERAPRAKIAQILAYGPNVMSVRGLGYEPQTERATWDNIRELCALQDLQMLITARSDSPASMEGAKTISYELCESLGGAPDIVYVPTGGGGLISSIWKGFKEWRDAGYSESLPRMVAVQPRGCDPIAQAWRAGRPMQPIDDCLSAVSGIGLTSPPDGDLVLQDLQESDGWAVSIDDTVTYHAQARLASQEGLFVEPAAAVTWAAVEADLAAGRITGGERIVCVLTGAGFKDSAAIQRMTEDKPVKLIEADAIPRVAD